MEESDSDSDSSSSSDGDDTSTGGESSTESGSISGTGGTGGTGGPETDSETMGLPGEPPSVLDVDLSPTTIFDNGPIKVTVWTDQEAEGVRLIYTRGQEPQSITVELESAGGGSFVGEIPVLTSLSNGKRQAVLVAWRGETEGEPVTAEYEIALTDAGVGTFWEASTLLGPGMVNAIGVFSNGELIELGTRFVDDESRCYLRARAADGSWFEDQAVEIYEGQECEAIDLKVSDTGDSFYVLANVKEIWRLTEFVNRKAPMNNVLEGAEGESAAALAITPGGVAVCGSVPAGGDEQKDAAAWLHRKDLPGAAWSFSYGIEDYPDKVFEVTPRDCIFREEVLVMVGEMKGEHLDADEEIPKPNRQFILEFNTTTETEVWQVATVELAAESYATAVTIDDDGRVLTAGYTQDGEGSKVKGNIRLYDSVDGLIWWAPLGTWIAKEFVPSDLEWSPAGYAVVTSGGVAGDEFSFTARAYSPLKMTPVWSYSHKGQILRIAYALAIGPYGKIYAGGLGPSIAFIGG